MSIDQRKLQASQQNPYRIPHNSLPGNSTPLLLSGLSLTHFARGGGRIKRWVWVLSPPKAVGWVLSPP